ncbi:tyrosine-type recombinase/integrase [Pseudarthrobacter psychrotolerans]|uniref:Tyrosine-type recombinase/integrase n=1 Tax=Pseudarthrobacter psychrotolerans TaxID=2697569 RepID=A0A6P1NT40_9MICC|nr:tyrosine-type recombinase/integrase [Pseudarthrobacter psychrotolerans]
MSLAVRSCTFSGVELRKVRRSHVETWVKEMIRGGLAAGTVRTRMNNVRSVLHGAVRDRLIAADPSDGVTLPRGRKIEHSMAIPAAADVGRVLAAAEPWFRPYVALCAFAGLRLGEAAAVQLADVDFLRRTLHVQRQVQRAGSGQVEITPPKYGSERSVALPDGLLELLSRHIRDVGVRGAEQWLFVGDHGLPPHQNTVGNWWRKTRAAAGMPALKLHDLRHFYASGLIAAGCDVVTVQRALGHAKATTTLNTYSHLWPTAADRTRAAAGGLMDAALPTSADYLRTSEG